GRRVRRTPPLPRTGPRLSRASLRRSAVWGGVRRTRFRPTGAPAGGGPGGEAGAPIAEAHPGEGAGGAGGRAARRGAGGGRGTARPGRRGRTGGPVRGPSGAL